MQDKQIRPIGSYLHTNTEGYIVKEASEDKFQEKWKPAINETVEIYREKFQDKLVAVYIRGSVAKGSAVDEISDLDSMAVIDLDDSEINFDWSEDFNRSMIHKYLFMQKVEICAIPKKELLAGESRADQLMIKTQSVCVYGEDISDQLPEFKPNKEACQHYLYIEKELRKTIDFLRSVPKTGSDETISAKCTWIMKRILRTCFELVMEREQKYTRDLYPCCSSFAKYYPKHETLAYKTLELAVYPSSNTEEVLPILEEWLNWAPREIEEIFKD